MRYFYLLIALLSITALPGCHSQIESDDQASSEVRTPVTIMLPIDTSISESILLNATSSFLKKNKVLSNVNGYIEKVYVNAGDFIEEGKPLFTFRTKESAALSSLNKKDSTFQFKGSITINAPSTGIVTQLTKQLNDYVSDGEELCDIAQQNSFVFLLDVPFEQHKYTTVGTSCKILLSDSTEIKGTITTKLSTIDPASQTERYILKPETSTRIPENLIAQVAIEKHAKQHAQVVDKSCVLSNESMQQFWIMKLINDSTAVRVDIHKGISTEQKTEILSPILSPNDRIVRTGNYGLPDTAFVNIQQP